MFIISAKNKRIQTFLTGFLSFEDGRVGIPIGLTGDLPRNPALATVLNRRKLI